MTDDQQPVLPKVLIRDCETVMGRLGVPHQEAAILVHAGAVAQHARQIGFVGAQLGPRAALDALAQWHPALAPMGELSMSPAVESEIDGLWSRHQLHDECSLYTSYPLGDLYQSLSVEAVKGRALCQTPWWITKLLLDISYDEAVEDFGWPRMIDPACGTGHILVGTLGRAMSAHKIFDGYSSIAPYATCYSSVPDALDRVRGVDVDAWAVVVARYRLLVRAWANLRHLGDDTSIVREFPVHVAAADSLLSTDEPLLDRGQYHVVVANPPYITVKDRKLNEAIRKRYPEVCNGKYSMALPFHQLMHELLVPGGYCAQLTANSFMKREFGTKYIEEWLTKFDLRWVIDTSGAYIPGHGTPTVILGTRNAPQKSSTVSTVRSVQGEPRAPEDPSKGLVWREIAEQVDKKLAYQRFARGGELAYRMDHPEAVAAPLAAVTAMSEPVTEPAQGTLFDLLGEGAA